MTGSVCRAFDGIHVKRHDPTASLMSDGDQLPRGWSCFVSSWLDGNPVCEFTIRLVEASIFGEDVAVVFVGSFRGQNVETVLLQRVDAVADAAAVALLRPIILPVDI